MAFKSSSYLGRAFALVCLLLSFNVLAKEAPAPNPDMHYLAPMAKSDDVSFAFVYSQLIQSTFRAPAVVGKQGETSRELKVLLAPALAKQVHKGQAVYLRPGAKGRSKVLRSRVLSVSSQKAADEQVQLTLEVKKLKSESLLNEGDTLEVQIMTSDVSVPLGVEKSAVVSFKGRKGIITVHNKAYHFIPVNFGIEGDTYIEVKSDLVVKTPYVKRNANWVLSQYKESNGK